MTKDFLLKGFTQTKTFLLTHKIVSLVIVLIILGVGYKAYGSLFATSTGTRYVVSAVGRGELSSVVSGTGQVTASRQINLIPKASGEVVYLGAKTGDHVAAGQLLMQIDAQTAKIDLETAKLSLQKMMEGKNSSLGGENGLAKDYEDAISNINSVFAGLPDIISGYNTIINDYQISAYKLNLPNTTARNYYRQSQSNYYQAKDIYEKTLAKYNGLERPLSNNDIVSIVNDTYLMLQALNQLAKDTSVYLSYTYDQSLPTGRTSAMISDKTNAETWLKTINSDLALVGTNRETLKNSSIDISSQKLAVEQKENAYQNYFLYAPLDGVVQIDVEKGDTVNSGSSIGTFVTSQKVATVALNEVDVTKVKLGQKAILSFDAVDGLEIPGQVVGVDVVGTVSQGVVSYNVKVAFAGQDDRIKPGMSVSADIVVDKRENVLLVPSSAIKTLGSRSYVETLGADQGITGRRGVSTEAVPQKIFIKAGLSDDTNTEVLDGLKEGDKIITQTLSSSSAAGNTASLTSLLRPGGQQRSTARNGSSGVKMNSPVNHD